MGLATFAGEAFAEFQSTAAIAPSSRFLAEAMAEPLPLARAKTVVEFGPGTGVMTRELLAHMPFGARLFAFEVNPRFVDYLRERIRDPRLEVVHLGAEDAAGELRKRGVEPAEAVLSSLGLGLLPEPVVAQLLDGAYEMLAEDGIFTQFQYVHRMRMQDGKPERFDAGDLLEKRFPVVERRLIVRNLPPAFVYACRKR